jgi:hypothetical protein
MDESSAVDFTIDFKAADPFWVVSFFAVSCSLCRAAPVIFSFFGVSGLF